MSQIIYGECLTINGSKVQIKYEIKYSGNAWQHIPTRSTQIIIRKLNQKDIELLHENGYKQYPEKYIDLKLSDNNLWLYQTEIFNSIINLLKIKI